MSTKKIVIVGGGFGGIMVALELADKDEFDVTLVSDQQNFRYYPTLYHAATGGKQAASSIPLTEIFKEKNLTIAHDYIKHINRDKKTVSGKKSYQYDELILALGVVTNFFGIKGLQEYAYGIKSIEEAVRLRDHIHKQLVDERKPDLNYVVIGGGPTGVELAGALPSYIHHIMKSHGIADTKIHVDLVEAAPRLMPRMPRSYSDALARRLKKLGIRLYLKEAVEAETADGLSFSGHTLESHTVVWTAGVTNHPFFKENNFTLTPHGKVIVNEYLETERNIYVIGDNADTQFSGMAQTALHDAKIVAHNLIRQWDGDMRQKYQVAKPAYATPVGPSWAALMWGPFHTYGWLGWVMRSAADWVGYHDFEPVLRATKQWMAEFGEEEACSICAGRQA